MMTSSQTILEDGNSKDYDTLKKANPSINAVSDGSQHTSTSDSKEQYTSTQSFFRSLQRYVWDDPDKPKHEKRFLLKLDFYLLTYAC
jgi:ACS family pantothenate transporter-like MFS transporter